MSTDHDKSFTGYELLSEIAFANAKILKARISPANRKAGAPELVALKVLPNFTKTDLKRLQQEAAILESLDHLHIVRVVEVRLTQALFPFIALEFIEGGDLRAVLAGGNTLTPGEVCRIGQQLCSAFGEFHPKGITHRDVKPDNILIKKTPPGGHFILTDFGIALAKGKVRLSVSNSSPRTLVYAAPEQCADVSVHITPAADYFALGVVLFEAVTGYLPYHDAKRKLLTYSSSDNVSDITLLQAICNEEPPPLSVKSGIPAWFEQIIRPILSKNPENRGLASLSDWSQTAQKLANRFEMAAKLWDAEQALHQGNGEEAYRLLTDLVGQPTDDEIVTPIAQKHLKKLLKKQVDAERTSAFWWIGSVWHWVNALSPNKKGLLAIGLLGFGYLLYSWTSDKQRSDYFSEHTGRMIFVRGGEYVMGDNAGNPEVRPEHTVEVRDFYMAEREVTVEEYLKFCNATEAHWPDWLEPGNDYHIDIGNKPFYTNLGYSRTSHGLPVVAIRYQDAVAFCEWASSKDPNFTYRLPTEAQWEYAARGGENHDKFLFSGSKYANRAGWNLSNSKNKPHAVKGLLPNSLGIYDLSGNVAEFCSDWYSADFYRQTVEQALRSRVENTTKPRNNVKVIRGGDWNKNPIKTTVTFRGAAGYGKRYLNVGFRVVGNPI